MIEFGGKYYMIDLDALDEIISKEESLKAQDIIETDVAQETVNGNLKTITTTRTIPKGKEIDGAMYDTIRLMLEIVMTREDDMDDTLGLDRALDSMPFNYKIAFNTLIKYKILTAVLNAV